MKINELRNYTYIYRELLRISKSLNQLATNDCNYGLTARQEKREDNLFKKAQQLAKQVGLKAYHQGDPRGCSLYLIDKTMDDTTYNNGIAIY